MLNFEVHPAIQHSAFSIHHSIMYPQLTGVVRHLLILNVLMYFGTLFLMGQPEVGTDNGIEYIDWNRLSLASFYPTSEYFRPFQIATHMFMHGSLGHLFFNMLSLYFFGTGLEMAMCAKRFLLFYLTCGLGAWALHMGVQGWEMSQSVDQMAYRDVPMLGASGAIFGVLAGYAMLFPNNVIQLLFPPIPLKAKYFVLIMAGLDLYLGINKMGPGVAHFAHVGGAIFGALLCFFWYKNRRLMG